MRFFNTFATDCEQIVENLLKAILETLIDDDKDPKLFHNHNLQRLFIPVNTKYPDILDEKTLAWIGGFYFNSRYPGTDFIWVTNETAAELKQCTENVVEILLNLLEQIYNEKQETTPTSYFS